MPQPESESDTDSAEAPLATAQRAVNVFRPLQVDLGLLYAADPLPLPQTVLDEYDHLRGSGSSDPAAKPTAKPTDNPGIFPAEPMLLAHSRAATQVLVNQLFALPSAEIKSAASRPGIHVTLPPPRQRISREKPLPVPKPPSRFERYSRVAAQFASKRGRSRLVFDEERQQLLPRYGRGSKRWLQDREPIKELKPTDGTPHFHLPPSFFSFPTSWKSMPVNC